MEESERVAGISDAIRPSRVPAPANASAIVSIRNLTKTYETGLTALKRVDLDIRDGEIFALLGPNGAGKTTLINIVCGIVTPSSGTISAGGHDVLRDYRAARMMIGLVPQELTTDRFESVWDTVTFSRGLFARPPNRAQVERVLGDLSLLDKARAQIQTLSGGMKRRVMIAKALVHQPKILFLDEPTAGVDVELRRDMWALVRRLRESGVTIILTTHYIDEAEEMADRIGVISKGELIVVEEKTTLMKKLGSKRLTLVLQEPLARIPDALAEWQLRLKPGGNELEYTFDINAEHTGVPSLLRRLSDLGIAFRDLVTEQSSLEDIFVSLVSERRGE
ncbi:MAG TPA: ABC transporter ATP-binding protein [Rhizomicrobium sp.]|nr:ABC transporter ATP-binding protein [Rhizomicrobium sp.]